jgi:hypothetical protein
VASFSPERTPTTFDDEETKISYNSLTDLYLPAKRPPSQTIVINIGNAATCSSLTLSTSVYLLTNKLDDDGLDYLFFEKEDSGPDTLHTPEKTYERRGTCRYIFEDDRGFVMYSKRGWLNCGELVFRIFFFRLIISASDGHCFLSFPCFNHLYPSLCVCGLVISSQIMKAL